MGKKIIRFHDSEIEEYEFYQHKDLILINDMGINEIAISNKLPFG